MKTAVSNQRILQLARLHEEAEAKRDAAQEALDAVREEIIAEVQASGTYPPKATTTRVLAADDGTELRVTVAQERSVRSDVALELRGELREAGMGRLFRKLFREIKQFAVAPKAHELAAARLPAALLKLFNRAIRAEEKSPGVEVRRPESSPRRARRARRDAA